MNYKGTAKQWHKDRLTVRKCCVSAIFNCSILVFFFAFTFFFKLIIHFLQVCLRREETQCPFRLWLGAALQLGQPRNQLCAAALGKQSPIPLPPHSLSPSSLHIVLLPISLGVINYKRHKPPGLMPCHGCLPSCTFGEPRGWHSLITPGTLSISPFTGSRKSLRRACEGPERHRRSLQSADEAYFL